MFNITLHNMERYKYMHWNIDQNLISVANLTQGKYIHDNDLQSHNAMKSKLEPHIIQLYIMHIFKYSAVLL